MYKRLVSVAFLVGMGAAGIIYYLRHKEDFYLITSVSINDLFVISLIHIIISICFGLQLKILMDYYKLDIGFFECYGLVRTSSFINLLLPFGGGASFKAIYLKKLLKFRYSSFIASMAITNTLKILIFALAAVFLVMSLGGILLAVSIVIFFAALLFLILGHKLERLDVSSAGYVMGVINEWQEIKKDRMTMAKLICLSLFLFAVASLNTWLLFRAFSVDIPLRAAGTIAAFTSITGLLNLVPGNLGIREALFIMISNAYGIEINESVHAAALGRILQIIWTFILASFFRYTFHSKTADTPTYISQRKGGSENRIGCKNAQKKQN
ncbi:flippase-like domain-containing protein [bacterium]|nr:flippase-like domain-containing protein [bacterium]